MKCIKNGSTKTLNAAVDTSENQRPAVELLIKASTIVTVLHQAQSGFLVPRQQLCLPMIDFGKR